MKKRIIAYTDGSAVSKKDHPLCGYGGYGVYLIIEGEAGNEEYFFNQGWQKTTISRMEVRAIITALQKIKNKLATLYLYSDSQYAVNCVNERWLWNWEKNNFNGVANADLMRVYLEEFSKFRYRPIFTHIKGHTKNDDEHSIGNAIADRLADYRQFNEYEIDVK